MTFNLSSNKTYIMLSLIIITALSASCQNKTSDESSWPNSLLLMPKGIQQDDMPASNSDGAKLTIMYCSQCHGIPYPAGHSASDWKVIMRKMMLYMRQSDHLGSGGGMMGGMRGGMMGNRNMPMGIMNAKVPSQSEQKLILSHLQNHSLKTIQENELPVSTSGAIEEFKKTCSKCHALPSPYQHTAKQWPVVVERMLKHMKEFNLPSLPESEINSITAYLQDAANKDSK